MFAQSVGGGGGAGGFSAGGGLSAQGGSASNTVGGAGGAGGVGGDVTLQNGGAIITLGANATAVLIQTVGGGGGVGGFAAGGSASKADGASQVVGGAGGVAGAGGSITIDNAAGAVIGTAGAQSDGVFAQSVGGGGGLGGFAAGGTLSLSGAANNTIGGGIGGSAGSGGKITFTNEGTVQTLGDQSIAVFAQSVGGGGGQGGFTAGGGLSASGQASNGAVGGAGGAGGDGGVLSLTNSGAVQTGGKEAVGIFAQSVGGGGGVGGFAIGGTASQDGAVTDTVGGTGGAGGVGGNITVSNKAGATVLTAGAFAYGIEAQSVGGGGGNGGMAASGSVSLNGSAQSTIGGGAGGGGGLGGTITLTNAGNIYTGGANAFGILAQSVGGGGGAGGMAGSFSASGGSTMGSTIGGAGGSASLGGAVSVTNTGQIEAAGANSAGILAESVGGGGGTGGFSLGASGSTASVASGLGGTGGGGGVGGAVTVSNASGATIIADGDLSYGVFAESVGGGGGKGGFAVGGTLSSSGNASDQLGAGSGGGGGDGGVVGVTNAGNVLAKGAGSSAVFAQSVGGGGGAGGFAGGLSVGSGGSVAETLGGNGGGAGNGAAVTVGNTGLIQTLGANSMGVFAQSVGGGGGKGGFSLSASGSSGSGTATSLGGTGGAGGSAGTVAVTNSGTIDDKGAISYGVFAQSVGGGGGVAGLAISGTLAEGSSGLTSALGGTGGGGGNGGLVNVTNTGSITVEGAASVGILAQSIGGGGGAGGFSGALAVSGGTLGNELGGQGGAGGNGANVSVTSTGSITTMGDDSVAILAQSIAGGGGSSVFAISAQTGTFDSVSLSLGAKSNGIKGTQGTVTVNVSGGRIISLGALSYGILAQAIGAGGGNGAISVPDPLQVGAGGVTLQVGGTGGVTGDGNTVNASNANPISTSGAGAVGFAAQSIGGGGGVEGVTGDVNLGTGNSTWGTSVGGQSTSAGSGLGVTVANTAGISTSGDSAIGLLAQSIGGGGGVGNLALGITSGSLLGANVSVGGSETTASTGGNITFTSSTGAITTTGNMAAGLVAQSVGGGGGLSAITSANGAAIGAGGVGVAAGSTGGAGGSGGTITLTQTGAIATSGDGSNGVLLQSVGGGGGFDGIDNGTQATTVTSASLGGAASGSGGAVTFNLNANVQTTGSGSQGVAVQSIGGGGGLGRTLGGTVNTPLTLGSSNGASGNGGAVTVNTTGTIVTTGAGSSGLVVQSIGGGGGDVLSTGPTGAVQNYAVQAAAGGGGGSGAATNVTVGAAITTTGANANGVVVQSIGGGGGVAGSNFSGSLGGAGSGGAVGLTVNANVLSTGAGSTALVAQSAGGTGAAPITLNIGPVAIEGGAGGHAVSLLGGTNNTVTNGGTLTTADGKTGVVIYASGGNNTITNSGTIIGSVDLGSGNNSLTNVAGGVFLAGPIVNLGSGTLTEQGIISPGGLNVVQSLALTGNFASASTTAYALDLDLKTNKVDSLNISGTATLAGVVTPNILNTGYAPAGTHSLIIANATNGITSHAGLTLNAPVSAIATFSLAYPDANDAALKYVIEFAPTGLTTQQARVGQLLDRIQQSPTAAFAPTVSALYAIGTVPVLGAVYDSLSGEGVVAAQTASLNSISGIQDEIETQRNGRVGADAAPYLHEALGNLWLARPSNDDRVNGSAGTHDVKSSGSSIVGGWDMRPNQHVVVGVAVSYALEHFGALGLNTSGKASVTSVGGYAGLEVGGWNLGADVLYSSARVSYARSMAIPGDTETAHGGFTLEGVSGRVSLSRSFQAGSLRLQPFGTLDITSLSLPAFAETSNTQNGGVGALNLGFGAKNATRTRSFLGTDVSGQLAQWGGTSLVASLRGSWVHDFDPARSVAVSFANAPQVSVDTFGAPGVKDAAKLDVRASVRAKGYELQFSVGTNLAPRTSNLSAQAGIRIPL